MTARRGRVVPVADRCVVAGCQMSRRPQMDHCADHAKEAAQLRAAAAWERRKAAWRERDRANRMLLEQIAAGNVAQAEGDTAAFDQAREAFKEAARAVVAASSEGVKAEADMEEAALLGATCPAHPDEGLLDCRGCESVAEDAIQGGDHHHD